ncbi:translation initiation factor IF-2-like [Zalophus californianus]|uniref:Translation initiation factor IF-2-like n=1 Tax=Zalophus californianus TaxID=9704 RepID=A0A6J2D352_ZALCA|nr:translation initiation factor IF-2-like [Zalophus californianus]
MGQELRMLALLSPALHPGSHTAPRVVNVNTEEGLGHRSQRGNVAAAAPSAEPGVQRALNKLPKSKAQETTGRSHATLSSPYCYERRTAESKRKHLHTSCGNAAGERCLAGACRGPTAVPGPLRPGLAPYPVPPPQAAPLRENAYGPLASCGVRTAGARPGLPLSRRRPRAEAAGAPPTGAAPAAPRPSRPSAREGSWEAGAESRCGAARAWRRGGRSTAAPGRRRCPRAGSRPRRPPARALLSRQLGGRPPGWRRAPAREQTRPRPTLVAALIQAPVPAPARGPRRPPRPPPAPRAPAAEGRADLASPQRRPSKHSPYDRSRPEAERRKPRTDERPVPKPNMAPQA